MPALEAVHLVRRAHVVVAAQAVSTLPTRHDLLRDRPITDLDPPPLGGFVVDLDDLADELVAWDHLGLGPCGAGLVTPEFRCPLVALEVARVDACRLHSDEGLARAGLRNRHLFQSVVLRAVTHHGLHRLVRHDDLLVLTPRPRGLRRPGKWICQDAHAMVSGNCSVVLEACDGSRSARRPHPESWAARSRS